MITRPVYVVAYWLWRRVSDPKVMGSSLGGCKEIFLENNDEFFNHFGLRFEIRSPTENLKMCYLDILKRRIRTMIIFQNSEFLALSYLRQGFNPLVMYPTYNWR